MHVLQVVGPPPAAEHVPHTACAGLATILVLGPCITFSEGRQVYVRRQATLSCTKESAGCQTPVLGSNSRAMSSASLIDTERFSQVIATVHSASSPLAIRF